MTCCANCRLIMGFCASRHAGCGRKWRARGQRQVTGPSVDVPYRPHLSSNCPFCLQLRRDSESTTKSICKYCNNLSSRCGRQVAFVTENWTRSGIFIIINIIIIIIIIKITSGLNGECFPERNLGITVLQAHPVGVTRVGK